MGILWLRLKLPYAIKELMKAFPRTQNQKKLQNMGYHFMEDDEILTLYPLMVQGLVSMPSD